MPRQKGRFQFRFFIPLHHGKATRLPRGPHESEFEQEVKEGGGGYEVNANKANRNNTKRIFFSHIYILLTCCSNLLE